jgi:dipeptidyl aminopeptidase/acylaminoacyl peptidase
MRTRPRSIVAALPFAITLLMPALGSGQGTLEDYRRAATINQRYANLTVGLVQGGPNWIARTDRFWYRVTVRGGAQFVVVDPDGWTKLPAFDHARLAAALSTAAGGQYTALTLPFTTFNFVNDQQAIEADAGRSRFRCTLSDYSCTRIGDAQGGGEGFGRAGAAGRGGAAGAGGRGGFGADTSTVRRSPDGTKEAFIQNYNIAIRPVRTGPPAGGGGRGGRGATPTEPQYTLLSTDGSEGDAYQLNSIEWSPDSKKLVAYRRRPGYTRLVTFVQSSPPDQVQPKTQTTATLGNPSTVYTKPGDALQSNQPAIFDVETKKQILVNNALFPNPYQISRPVWRKDGKAYSFQYNQRGHQIYRVLEVDAETGAVHPQVDEVTKTFFAYREVTAGLSDTGHNYSFDVGANCQLSRCRTYDGKEIIWMSERDGWAHLYMVDGATGTVKNQITKGPWLVKYVDSVDVAQRQIYFRALAMNKNQDPYFVHFYRINFDGTGLVTYTEADGTHNVDWSPSRKYYVDTYSRVDLPTIVELRRVSDKKMLPLEKGDMSAALAAGWKPPEIFVSKARDGVTDIWGIIVRPSTVDPNKKYPVVESIYAGPQGSFVPKAWGGGGNFQAMAELGFVVVQIDGMGTNNRSKAFHDVAWKNLADAGFADRILWHQAVNKKYPYYDITRVGIYGGSAGGQNAAGAVFFHPEFYDAAFASSGCHDNRMDKIWWNEQWMGEMGPHYDASSNVTAAKNLKGHLFLAVGELDTNVDPSSTLQVANALLLARKTFEMLVVPNGGHGATGPEGTRLRNDFFVRHLLGVTPPNWNAVALEAADNGNGNGFGFGAFEDELPPYGFFDSPEDSNPRFFWW